MKQTTAEWRASLKVGDQWFVARKSKSGSEWSLFRCEVTAMDRGITNNAIATVSIKQLRAVYYSGEPTIEARRYFVGSGESTTSGSAFRVLPRPSSDADIAKAREWLRFQIDMRFIRENAHRLSPGVAHEIAEMMRSLLSSEAEQS